MVRRFVLIAHITFLLGATWPGTAATVTWNGSADGFWSNGQNWDGGTVPVENDQLVFPAGVTTNLATINDLPAGLTFHSITVSGGVGAISLIYTIGGNGIRLTDGINAILNSPATAAAVTFDLPIQLAGTQTFSFRSGYETMNSPIDLNGFDLTIHGYGTPVNGAITGAGDLTLATNEVQLNANNTHTGTTFINTWGAINGTQSESDVVVNVVLFGTGPSVGDLIVNGILTQGVSSNQGRNGTTRLSTRNLSFDTAPSLMLYPSQGIFDINGITPQSDYDQLRVTGTVDIGADASLVAYLAESFSPPIGQTFTLIDNDGSDPIIGFFRGLPEGDTLTLNDVHVFRVSYAGGSGNDLVLTAVLPAPIPALDRWSLLALILALPALAVLMLSSRPR